MLVLRGVFYLAKKPRPTRRVVRRSITKFNELLEVTKDIDLEALGVSLGKAANRSEMISCFVDGDEWVMQEVDDRQRVFEKRDKEEDIVRKVYGNIKLRIRQPK